MVLAGLPLIVVKAVVGGKSEKPKEPESVVGVEQLPNQHTEIKTVPMDTYSPKSKPISVSSSCRYGSPVLGRFYVKDREVNFRTGPGSNNGLVINNKATQATGKTFYRKLSRSTVLAGRCQTKKWLQAKIVEGDGIAVDYEVGWVHKQFVSRTASSDYLAGLYWDIEDDDLVPASKKKLVKQGALKVLKDEPKCAGISYGGSSSSRKNHYFVNCGGFNVYFKLSDISANKPIKQPKPYNAGRARRACVNAIRSRALHPSSVDIHWVTGSATKVHNNGRLTIIQAFDAKNMLGVELSYTARCLFDPDGDFEITIVER